MTVKEFDNLLSAAKRGKKIIRKVKRIYYGEDSLKETVVYENYVDFLNLQMNEIVNTNPSLVTVFEIEEDAPSNYECQLGATIMSTANVNIVEQTKMSVQNHEKGKF